MSTVVTGASGPKQVVENVKAVDMAPGLTNDIMERIERIVDNRPEV